MHRPPLPTGTFLVLIFTRAMERSEGNMSLKNSVTPAGIDPGTVRLVAQHLNHYATPGPHTTLGRTPQGEWSTRRRHLYLTTYDTHKRHTSMSPDGFEHAIPARDRPQTHALEHAATAIGRHCKLPDSAKRSVAERYAAPAVCRLNTAPSKCPVQAAANLNMQCWSTTLRRSSGNGPLWKLFVTATTR
jgi:hypothetical protein